MLVFDFNAALAATTITNVDAASKLQLKRSLKELTRTLQQTIVYVTHDQIEALTMADRIAVLDAGCLLQVGTPTDIYDRPATTVVAQLVGTPRINLLPAQAADGHLRVTDGDIHLPLESVRAEKGGGALRGPRPCAHRLPGRKPVSRPDRTHDLSPGL